MNKSTPLNSGMSPDLKIEVAIIGADYHAWKAGCYALYAQTIE